MAYKVKDVNDYMVAENDQICFYMILFFKFRSNSKSHRKESRLSRAELEARYQEKGQLTFS